MIPPLKECSEREVSKMALQSLLPIDVEGDRQYFISMRHGHIVDRHHLLRILRDGVHSPK
jgi:hypothetical protein